MTGLNQGVRRMDHEMLIGFFNLTTQGVLSNHKLHFALSQLTTLAHNSPKSFVGVLVLPNRAGDIRVGSVKFLGCFSESSLSFLSFSNQTSFR